MTKRTLKSLWIALAFFFVVPQASGQIIGLDLLGNKKEVTVPFSYEQGFIIVKFWLNGIIPLRMILDTGAQNTILFDKEIAQILGIKYERKITIMGSDLDSVLQANIARRVRTRLDGCTTVYRDIIVLDENTLLLSEKLGTEINGIVGGAFFANLVMELDYNKEEITFKHPEHFEPPKFTPKKWWQFWKPKSAFHDFGLDIINHKPYMQADVSVTRKEGRDLKLLLDTGASLPFLVHANTDTTIQLPNRMMIGKVGYGLTGEILGYRGKSHLLKMGDIKFSDIVTSFQDLELVNSDDSDLIRNGIIGNILLERFTVIIDYTKSRLYLRPTRKFDEEFDFDKSGLTTLAVGPSLDQFYIVAVIKGSPADKADIRPGDLITRINRKKARKLTLDRINTMLSGKEGKQIRMTILRGQKEFKKSFRLKEWFTERTL